MTLPLKAFVLTGLLSASFSYADENSITCFDLSKKITKPLLENISFKKNEEGHPSYEKDTIGATEGTVSKSISSIYKLLIDHNTTKSSSVDEMSVEEKQDANNLARHLVKFKVFPFPFVTIEWTEDWAYTLLEGTKEAPIKILITYQKIEGTSHIGKLCGSIVLKKVSENETHLTLIEDAKASRRDSKDTVEGLVGTIKTLRDAK